MISIDRLRTLARLVKAKDIVVKELMAPKRGGGVFEPHKFSKKVKTERFLADGFPCITVEGGAFNGKHVVFFHGGSYISEGLTVHRRFIERLATEYGYRVTYVDYPLAPEHVAVRTLAVARLAYEALRAKYPQDGFVLMGDSAGGGLALSLLQILKKENAAMPECTVLLSPWLDLSLSHLDAPLYEQKDPTLSIAGLRYAGERYRGELDERDPLVSPLFGGLVGLGRIFVSVGTDELFCPDCLDLYQRCRGCEGTDVRLFVFEEMFHDFVMIPMKSSKEAMRLIDLFIRGEDGDEKEVHIVTAST